MSKLRSMLYTMARLLGDVEAVASLDPSRMAKRFVNRAIGRRVAPMMYLRAPRRRRR